MIIKRTKLWWLRGYRWKVYCEKAYTFQRRGDHYFILYLKDEYHEWLVNTVKGTLLFKPFSRLQEIHLSATNGQLTTNATVPPILFRHKKDIVLFKLVFG